MAVRSELESVMQLNDYIQDIGDGHVRFYPQLCTVLGNSNATLFACLFIGWTGSQKDPDGWIYKTQSQIEEETGLTRTEQQTARKTLTGKGFMEEKHKGIPCQLHYRVNLAAINSAWGIYKLNKQNQQNSGNPQTRTQKKSKQVCRKGPNLSVEKYCANTSTTTENTHKTTTTDEFVVVENDIFSITGILEGTPFRSIPQIAIRGFLQKYSILVVKEIAEKAAFQSKKQKISIDSPISYFRSLLASGMETPNGYKPITELRQEENQKLNNILLDKLWLDADLNARDKWDRLSEEEQSILIESIQGNLSYSAKRKKAIEDMTREIYSPKRKDLGL